MLYTVYFTSRHMVSKYDDKGRLISDYTADIPQTITALPYATAMQYKTCDNFRCERYQVGNERLSGGYASTSHGKTKSTLSVTSAASKPGTSTLKTAAATGNLAAAVSKP